MAPVRTNEISNVTMQELIDAGVNGFALQLLVESYARPDRLGELPKLTLVWRGVKVTLEEYDGPVAEPNRNESTTPREQAREAISKF